MNKKELSEELGLSLVTISRYISMGLPYEKTSGRYDFDLDEVQDWIDRHIDRRPYEYRMTREQAVQGLITLSSNLLKFIDMEKLSKSLKVESGEF